MLSLSIQKSSLILQKYLDGSVHFSKITILKSEIPWSGWLKCSATAFFLECRTSARCSLSLSETVLSVSPTYTTRSHFMPYTAFHVSHPLCLLILTSGWSDPFTMLSVRILEQIWHFGEQKVSVFSSLVLNILLCLPCTKISPRFRSLLNATIGGDLKIVFIRSDLWSKFRCFFVILWISGNCLAYVITNGTRSFVFFCFRYWRRFDLSNLSTAGLNKKSQLGVLWPDYWRENLHCWPKRYSRRWRQSAANNLARLHQWRQSNADCLRCRLCVENIDAILFYWQCDHVVQRFVSFTWWRLRPKRCESIKLQI